MEMECAWQANAQPQHHTFAPPHALPPSILPSLLPHTSCSYEEYLKDILRGVDPALDPSLLPAVAQSHISNVNIRRPGGGGGGAAGTGAQGGRAGPPLETVRHDVEQIKRRIKMLGPGGKKCGGVWIKVWGQCGLCMA